jgi:polar amino acid transport system substrate-binding protein
MKLVSTEESGRMKLMVSLVGVVMLFVFGSLTDLFEKIHFPNDGEDTLKKVQNGTLRVGFTNAEPWISSTGTGAQGLEAGIINEFAASLHAKVSWIQGTEEQLYKALRRNEIDVLLAGITDQTPWKKEVGLTRPYLETAVVVGRPSSLQGSNNSSSIEGQTIAVKPGTVAGYLLRKKKAQPFYTEQLPAGNMLSAGYDWQLQQWGLQNTGIELEKERHVMAVAPGENAFLLALDKFLYSNKESISKQVKQKG